MSVEERIKQIKDRLISALQPKKLNVIDKSHNHYGRSGAMTGKGHFSVEITAKAFKDKTPL